MVSDIVHLPIHYILILMNLHSYYKLLYSYYFMSNIRRNNNRVNIQAYISDLYNIIKIIEQ